MICRPTGSTGLSVVVGSWNTKPTSRPRSVLSVSASAETTSVPARRIDPVTSRVVRQQARRWRGTRRSCPSPTRRRCRALRPDTHRTRCRARREPGGPHRERDGEVTDRKYGLVLRRGHARRTCITGPEGSQDQHVVHVEREARKVLGRDDQPGIVGVGRNAECRLDQRLVEVVVRGLHVRPRSERRVHAVDGGDVFGMRMRLAENGVVGRAVDAVRRHARRELLHVADTAEHGIEVALEQGVDELGPLLQVELHLDAGLVERALDDLADQHRRLVAAVDHQLPVALVGRGEAGLLEQRLRLVEAEAVARVVRAIEGGTRRRPGQRDHLAESGIARRAGSRRGPSGG